MTGKFPLPPNFFRCPPLTADESNYMCGLARKSLLDLVRHSRIEGGPIKWTLDSDESGLQIYSGEDPTAPSEMRFLCSTTEVMATIEEAASLFRLETTELFREYLRMFAKDLLDAASLYTLAMPTEQHPRHYIGVKWTCLESPTSLIKNRDWCYLECQDDFEINGRRGWARSLNSIKLPCCPDLQNSLGIVRASFYRTGYVFLETDRPGYLQVLHAIQVDFKGNVPSWVVKIGMKKRARSIGEIDQYLREKRLSGEKFLVDHELVPKVARSKCFLCHKKYGAFTKKHNCRRCGEVVCSSCSKFWNVEMNSHRVHVRVCSACSIGAFNKGLPSVQAFPDNVSMTSIDASTKAVPFDRKSALAPTTPRQGQAKREMLEKQRTKARDDIAVQAHSKDTSSTKPLQQPRPAAAAVQGSSTPPVAPVAYDAAQVHQHGRSYPRYDDDRRGQHYDATDDPDKSESFHDYAPLNARNLEIFSQQRGRPPPQLHDRFDMPPPQHPSYASDDRYYDHDRHPSRQADEDPYYRPRHGYDYPTEASALGADEHCYSGQPPRDRRYDSSYYRDQPLEYNAYRDDRYAPYGQQQQQHWRYDDVPDHREYYEEDRYYNDRRGAPDAYQAYSRYNDPRAPPPRYHDRYDDYRYEDGTVADEDMFTGSSTRDYPSENGYLPRGEGRYPPQDEDDSYLRRDEDSVGEGRRRADDARPPHVSDTDDQAPRPPNAKDADLAALFKQMEALGLKVADGESSQQQLLALYKHLQQMNLESTLASPEAA
ncbi:hypothetical protein H310_12556 [Aphanomyces invadans]|uniref:FYVE-type domain-containing protein n=1 Tax=Aphanomyces invadans TaxID=157072 RepID=A0A024TJK6_9STRA|nr:hypothetical protein H310_12556 [Aphanomyces invadans]ETV93517.1 hypothetical protein H310_12556 [Aphanomyces invadans]|eukprot:XP_008877859.1 hypothetical protein H310_12556 [Aphanomyces invadans]